MARPKLPSHLRRNFPLRIGLTHDEDTRLWRAAEASGLTREAYVRSLLWPGADVLRIARPLLPSEGQERETVLFADAALKAEVNRGARKCRMLPLDFLRAVIEGAVASASPSLHRLVERIVGSLRETDRCLADEVEAHLVASPKLVEPDSEHVAQVEECLAIALASSPWADRSKDTVNPAGMPPSWVVHARFLLREKAPPSSPPIPQADLRGPDREPRPLSDEPLTEPIKHQWPALGGRPLIAGPIQPPAPPPLDPPGTVYLDGADPAATLTLDTPPPDAVSLSTSGRVEVRHRTPATLPTPTAENIADKVRALCAEFASQRYPLAPGVRPTDDVEPTPPDARVQEVQAALDTVAEPRTERARAIIAGGRHYVLTDADRATLDGLHAAFTIDEVISGGATGADAGGEHWAKDRGIPVRRFPADWDHHGRAAGPLRNAAMADYLAKAPGAPHLCILFPGGDGTASMRAEAVKRGIRVIEVGSAELAPIAAVPVAAPTPCPKCNGAGRIGVPPVRFRCPVCAGSGKASANPQGDRHASP